MFYGPGGTPRAESWLGIRFLFTGREWLGSVGLYDYRHRVYSSVFNRFLQVDPILALFPSDRFSYCSNKVVLCLDPSGLSSRDVVRILQVFDKAIEEMVREGKRARGHGRMADGWNNLNRLWNEKIYLCTGQAYYLKRRLDSIRCKLDDQWEFEEVFSYKVWDVLPIPWPAHEYIVARSSNPRDPLLRLDPYRGEFGVRY